MNKPGVLAALVALVLGATTALAQPKAKPSASAAPSAAPAPSGSALPAGHPPVQDGELPPGHPPMDADDDGDDPHGGAVPGGGAVPQDSVSEDPTLPAGTLVVTIKDGNDKPVPHAVIRLAALHSTVAKGDSSQDITRETGEDGAARFEGLSVGGGYSYRASTVRGSASYGSPTFGLGAKAGKRVTVHAYEASGKLDGNMLVVMQSIVVISLREGALQVQELLTVMNMGRVAWLADQAIELPHGFKAFNKQDRGDDARIEEVAGQGAALRGTFPPGQRDLEFSYQVPLEGESTQALRIRLPNRVSMARVAAEASPKMTLTVKGFPLAKPVDGRDGKRVLLTDFQARAPGEASDLLITLTGLPTQGPGRWIAVVLAALALLAGIGYFAQSGDAAVDEDARRDLLEAREALLGEIVALERAHKSGEVGPKTYARVRASLLDALARIMTMIESSDPKKRRKSPPGRRAEATL